MVRHKPFGLAAKNQYYVDKTRVSRAKNFQNIEKKNVFAH